MPAFTISDCLFSKPLLILILCFVFVVFVGFVAFCYTLFLSVSFVSFIGIYSIDFSKKEFLIRLMTALFYFMKRNMPLPLFIAQTKAYFNEKIIKKNIFSGISIKFNDANQREKSY